MSTSAFAAEAEREKTVMTAAPSATERDAAARSVNFRVAERPKPDAPAPATARTAAPIEAAPATSSEDEALTASSLGELAAFVGRAAEYESTLPEDVAAYYLREGGGAGDATLVKVVALAADHFLANPSGSARGPRKDLNGTWPRKDLNGTWPRKDWNGTVNASCFSIFEELKERAPRPAARRASPTASPTARPGQAQRRQAREAEGGGKGKGKAAERTRRTPPTFEAAFPATNGTFPKDDVERCFAEFGEKKREKEATVLGEEKALEYELYGVDGDAAAGPLRTFDERRGGGRPADRAPPVDELFEPREDASDEPEEAAAASGDDDDEEQDPAIVKKAHAHAAKVSSAKASAQRISPDCKEKLADGGRVYPAACKEKECDLEAPPIAACRLAPLSAR
ncbi:polynucleotide adenylyltransferase [Aureococcus anophagefferens]|uniref:Polynucleotide adenylyltransferase n=1 Tax=Aureococcus anophagefferens TaxID=44056 RepID=A0ABR1FGR3_AURAN